MNLIKRVLYFSIISILLNSCITSYKKFKTDREYQVASHDEELVIYPSYKSTTPITQIDSGATFFVRPTSAYAKKKKRRRVKYKSYRGWVSRLTYSRETTYRKWLHQRTMRSIGYDEYRNRTRKVESRIIHTGPRGGRYYINSYGNKTYIKRN